MLTNANKKSQKVAQNYKCEFCNYITVRKNDYDKHILTAKHQMLTNANKKSQKLAQNNIKIFRCDCGKEYKHNSTLSRHKTICNFINNNDENIISNKNISNHDNIIDKLIYENRDLTNKIVKQSDMISELAKEPKTINNNTTNNTTNNNNMTINVLLNEYNLGGYKRNQRYLYRTKFNKFNIG
jgi:hypothetical protein